MLRWRDDQLYRQKGDDWEFVGCIVRSRRAENVWGVWFGDAWKYTVFSEHRARELLEELAQ